MHRVMRWALNLIRALGIRKGITTNNNNKGHDMNWHLLLALKEGDVLVLKLELALFV